MGHLRVFGCICYPKQDTSHLKKLDDRSRELVHLGVEPGSYAYRLYDPKNCKVVVSPDVIFVEDNTWRWNKVGDDTYEASFDVTFPVYDKEIEAKPETEDIDQCEEEKDNDHGDNEVKTEEIEIEVLETMP